MFIDDGRLRWGRRGRKLASLVAVQTTDGDQLRKKTQPQPKANPITSSKTVFRLSQVDTFR